MNLRNKKTGEVLKEPWPAGRFVINTGSSIKTYDSLAKLNEDWEDYEEPKTFWYIRCSGEVYEDESDASTEHGEKHREIGNYFETREEAEKAVKKLKAWKRLRDEGIKLGGWTREGDAIYPELIDTGGDVSIDDLELLFGGEE